MRLQTLDLKTSSSALPRLGRRRNLGGHSWGFIPHCSQQCYKMFAQLSIERQMFWVNLREDSNLRWSNIGITCSTYCAEKTLWIDVYETKMAGRRSRGFKPQIYRCCSLIIYIWWRLLISRIYCFYFTLTIYCLFLEYAMERFFRCSYCGEPFSGPINRALPVMRAA